MAQPLNHAGPHRGDDGVVQGVEERRGDQGHHNEGPGQALDLAVRRNPGVDDALLRVGGSLVGDVAIAGRLFLSDVELGAGGVGVDAPGMRVVGVTVRESANRPLDVDVHGLER